MFQRKLIVTLGLVLALALSAGTSQASLSRVEGMSLTVPTLSQFTDDYANIYYFPTSVVRQNNLVLAELGDNPSESEDAFTPGNQSFTVVRNFPRFGAVAFQMKQSAVNNYTGSSNLNNEQLDAIWGKAFTKVDFAVRLDITNSSAEATSGSGATSLFQRARGIDALGGAFDPYPLGTFPADAILDNVELNTVGITPAITIHMQNDNRLEAAVTYRKYSLDRTEIVGGVQQEKWEDDGSASYAVTARAFVNKGDRHVWVPAAWYVNDDLTWKATNVPAAGDVRSVDETYKAYGVGISDNMRVNESNLLLWGVTVGQSKHEFERTDTFVTAGELAKFEDKTTLAPLVFAAIETDATRWLKVRIGANRALVNTRTETSNSGSPVTTEKSRTSEFNFNLGTGIKLNNLDIDMTLNEEFPFTGGNFLSGSEQAAFTRASATYHF